LVTQFAHEHPYLFFTSVTITIALFIALKRAVRGKRNEALKNIPKATPQEQPAKPKRD
jgi:hypothetical protein